MSNMAAVALLGMCSTVTSWAPWLGWVVKEQHTTLLPQNHVLEFVDSVRKNRKWEMRVNQNCYCKNCESNSWKLNTSKESIYLCWKLFFPKGLQLLCRKLRTIDAFWELQMSCIWPDLTSNCWSAETSHSSSSHPIRGGWTEICEGIPWGPLRTSE